MRALHPGAVRATLFVRAVVVRLPPRTAAGPLGSVEVAEFDLLHVGGDDGVLCTGREQVFKFLGNRDKLTPVSDTIGNSFF